MRRVCEVWVVENQLVFTFTPPLYNYWQTFAVQVVLAACSPFFRDLLVRHPHPSPLLYLTGVASADLAAVLEFIYNGAVNIAQTVVEQCRHETDVTGIIFRISTLFSQWQKTCLFGAFQIIKARKRL